MSSYLRSIPNKFTSFVSTRRPVTNLDYQLTKHVKSSLVPEEILGTRERTNPTTKHNEICIASAIPFSYDDISCFNVDLQRTKLLFEKHVPAVQHRVIKFRPQKEANVKVTSTLDCVSITSGAFNNDAHLGRTLLNFKNNRSNLLQSDSPKQIANDVRCNCEKEKKLYVDASLGIQSEREKQAPEDQKPTETQLQNVFNILQNDLPLLFIKQMNYNIYTPDLVFVNNIRGTTTSGISQYMIQIALLKIIGHLKYAYVTFSILKMTMHPEDNSIKVRWRIIGVSGTRVFLMFWKLNISNIKERDDNKSAWYDGFSTFYINEDGKVYKHVVDKMMPDQDIKEKLKAPLAPKLALFTALLSLDTHYFIKLCSKRQPDLFRIK